MDTAKLIKIIVPTVLEAIVCVALATGIVTVIHFNEIIQFISQSSAITSDQLSASYNEQLQNLDRFKALQTLVIVSFWASVGLGAYILYLVVSQAVTGLRNELLINTQFTNRGGVSSMIIPTLLHIALAVTFIAGLWLSAKVGLPFWLGLVDQLFYNSNWIAGIAGQLAMAANIYLLWILFQLVRTYR